MAQRLTAQRNAGRDGWYWCPPWCRCGSMAKYRHWQFGAADCIHWVCHSEFCSGNPFLVGIFFLALVSSIGGGLIRDGVFIPATTPTPLLTDARYIEVIIAATVVCAIFGRRIKHFRRAIAIIDALGLGAYATFGTQKALFAGLAIPAAVLVGVINAAGGGLLRDLITREEPLVFKPGQFYALAAHAGSVLFVFFVTQLQLTPTHAAVGAIGLTFVFRILSITLNWRTTSVSELTEPNSKSQRPPESET